MCGAPRTADRPGKVAAEDKTAHPTTLLWGSLPNADVPIREAMLQFKCLSLQGFLVRDMKKLTMFLAEIASIESFCEEYKGKCT